MVCLLTPCSRATSSVVRPASTCFSAAMICASVCRLLLIVLPLSFVQIVFRIGRIQGVRSRPTSFHSVHLRKGNVEQNQISVKFLGNFDAVKPSDASATI